MRTFSPWTSWRPAEDGEPIARLVLHAGLRAFVWFAAWHVADVLGASVVVAVIVLVMLVIMLSSHLGRGGGLRHSRHRRPPPRSGFTPDEASPLTPGDLPAHRNLPAHGKEPTP